MSVVDEEGAAEEADFVFCELGASGRVCATEQAAASKAKARKSLRGMIRSPVTDGGGNKLA